MGAGRSDQSLAMPALGLRLRAWLRGRGRLVLVTALLVGVVAGLAMGLVAGTRRTASAPDRSLLLSRPIRRRFRAIQRRHRFVAGSL